MVSETLGLNQSLLSLLTRLNLLPPFDLPEPVSGDFLPQQYTLNCVPFFMMPIASNDFLFEFFDLFNVYI